MATTYEQADRLTDRNREIWLSRACGATLAQIADAHGMSVSNVHRIVEQVGANMPAEGKDVLVKLTVESYDRLDRELWEIALAPGKQRIAPNGKPIYGLDGVPELDNTEKLAAIDRLLKSQLQRTKLLGTEAPATSIQANVPLVPPAEVQRVVLENAAKAQMWIARDEMRDQIRAEIMQEMAHAAIRN